MTPILRLSPDPLRSWAKPKDKDVDEQPPTFTRPPISPPSIQTMSGAADGDRWPHGLRAAGDLLSAFGIDGADQEGNRCHPQLRCSVTSWAPMREAIASYATRAAEKMRRYRVAAQNIFVFMHTNTFNNDPFYSNGASARFVEITNDTGEVVALAVRLGERLLKDGFRYSKCGVMITELLPETTRQPALGRAGPRS